MSDLNVATESKALGDVTYTVAPLTTRSALRVACKLLKMSAPGFADVAALRAAAGAIGRMLSGVASDIDDDVLWSIAEEFAKVTTFTRDSKVSKLAPTLDLHFQGRLTEFAQWVQFSAEVTYGPLVAWLQRLSDEAKAKAEAEAKVAKFLESPAAG